MRLPVYGGQSTGRATYLKVRRGDVRRVGIVLVGTIPWVDDTISHQFSVDLSRCRL